ncbi:PAS domain-containing protein [Rhodococcus koreensis]
MERRAPNPETALGYLERLPALVLLRRVPVPVLVLDGGGVVVHANAAFELMLGYPEGALADRSITEFVDPESVASGADVVARFQACAGRVIDLCHWNGFVVRATPSRAVPQPGTRALILVAFTMTPSNSGTVLRWPLSTEFVVRQRSWNRSVLVVHQWCTSTRSGSGHVRVP